MFRTSCQSNAAQCGTSAIATPRTRQPKQMPRRECRGAVPVHVQLFKVCARGTGSHFAWQSWLGLKIYQVGEFLAQNCTTICYDHFPAVHSLIATLLDGPVRGLVLSLSLRLDRIHLTSATEFQWMGMLVKLRAVSKVSRDILCTCWRWARSLLLRGGTNALKDHLREPRTCRTTSLDVASCRESSETIVDSFGLFGSANRQVWKLQRRLGEVQSSFKGWTDMTDKSTTALRGLFVPSLVQANDGCWCVVS